MDLPKPDALQPSLVAQVEAALPIEDLVAWLIEVYPAASEREIMGHLQEVYQAHFSIGPSGAPERKYAVGDEGWNAYPQRVSAAT